MRNPLLVAPFILALLMPHSQAEPDANKQIVVSKTQLLEDMSQHAFLSYFIRRITDTDTTDKARAIHWTRWLRENFHDSSSPPIDDDGQAIYSPLWLLSHHIAQCGQINRLVVDGLNSIHITARLIQLSHHVAAEAFFDGSWHYLDADALVAGQFVLNPTGTIASAAQITANLALLDNIVLSPTYDITSMRIAFTPSYDPSTHISTPFVWRKTASPQQENNIYYGWNHFIAIIP